MDTVQEYPEMPVFLQESPDGNDEVQSPRSAALGSVRARVARRQGRSAVPEVGSVGQEFRSITIFWEKRTHDNQCHKDKIQKDESKFTHQY